MMSWAKGIFLFFLVFGPRGRERGELVGGPFFERKRKKDEDEEIERREVGCEGMIKVRGGTGKTGIRGRCAD